MRSEWLSPRQRLARQLGMTPGIPPASPPGMDVCNWVQAELPLFVSDELAGRPADDPERYQAVADHLDLCPDCLLTYTTLSEMLVDAFYGEQAA